MAKDYDTSAIKKLTTINRESLGEMEKTDIIEVTLFLSRHALRTLDRLLGAREVAEMFNRKKSWIYDAMTRPRTHLQRELAKRAIRMDGNLYFRLSDAIMVRESLFERDGECPN